jgi:hypothetical protein
MGVDKVTMKIVQCVEVQGRVERHDHVEFESLVDDVVGNGVSVV